MDLAIIIFSLLCVISLYFLIKNKDKDFLWLLAIGLIFIFEHMISNSNWFGGINRRYFFIFDVIIYAIAIWFIFIIDAKGKKWQEFMTKMKSGFDYLYLGMIIEDDNKFLLLDPKDVEPSEYYLRIPLSDNVDRASVAFKLAKKSLKRDAGINLLKFKKHLGTVDGKSNNGDNIRILNYSCEVKIGKIQLNRDKFRNYYWVAVNDEKFLGLPKPIQNILIEAKK